MSESFFIYDCLAKERLLPGKNIASTGFFTQFNNCAEIQHILLNNAC